MKNNVKLIMENWRKFISEVDAIDINGNPYDTEYPEPEGEQPQVDEDPELLDASLEEPLAAPVDDDNPGYHFEDDFEEEI